MVSFKRNLSILKVQLVACLVAGSILAQDQNYITPLKDKSNLTTSGGEKQFSLQMNLVLFEVLEDYYMTCVIVSHFRKLCVGV